MQKLFATALTMIALLGCAPMTTQATATESAICRAWGHSLPTRSRADTAQTQAEIQIAYADFQNACPALARLVPPSVKKD